MAGTIDMIITKSISRFARNTLDCLKYIRQLKDKHIPVFFEKENINTMDSKGEVLLTIMASLAQQESQSLSQNVKLGLQYRYQRGEVQINCNHFLGYAKDENKHMILFSVCLFPAFTICAWEATINKLDSGFILSWCATLSISRMLFSF